VFERPPILPVVIKPEPDETLSNWVRALAQFYGQTPFRFLRTIGGKPTRADLRTLDISPQPRYLASLSHYTGISTKRLREGMTFSQRSRSIQSRINFLQPLCPTCTEHAAHALRPIELRNWFAPWLFFCKDHPPVPTVDELDSSIGISTILREVAQFSAWLEKESRSVKRCDHHLFHDVGNWLDFVREINSHVTFRVRRDQKGVPVFEVLDESITTEYEPARQIATRNTLIISAWYASFAAKEPARFLHHNTRSRDERQAHRLLNFLVKFLTPEVLYVPWRQACHRSRHPSRLCSDNFLRQARLLKSADFNLSPYALRKLPEVKTRVSDKVRGTKSPHSYTLPAYAIPVGSGTKRKARRPKKIYHESIPQDESAVPIPYSTVIEQVMLELANKGRLIQFHDIKKLAFRRMREYRKNK
jgi:hypothetical protein